MKRRKWLLLVSIAGGIVAVCVLAVVIFGAVISAKGYGFSTGRVYFAENGTYLIDSDDMAMQVADLSKNETLFDNLNNGDEVILLHNWVETSYPAQTGGYLLFCFSKGDGTYKPEDEVLGIYPVDESDAEHMHGPVDDAQIVDDPVTGYCGNIVTTVRFADGTSHTFEGSESVNLTDVVINLAYDINKICKCRSEYTVITESGTEYGVHLHGEGYVRCEEGQAELTEEQIKTVTQIIEWAKEHAK